MIKELSHRSRIAINNAANQDMCSSPMIDFHQAFLTKPSSFQDSSACFSTAVQSRSDSDDERDDPDEHATSELAIVSPNNNINSNNNDSDSEDDFQEEMALVSRYRKSIYRESQILASKLISNKRRHGQSQCHESLNSQDNNDVHEYYSSEFNIDADIVDEEPSLKRFHACHVNTDDDDDDDDEYQGISFLPSSPTSSFHHPAILRATTICDDASSSEEHHCVSHQALEYQNEDPPEVWSRSSSPLFSLGIRTSRTIPSTTTSSANQDREQPAWLLPMKTAATPLFTFHSSTASSSSSSPSITATATNGQHQPFLFGNAAFHTHGTAL